MIEAVIGCMNRGVIDRIIEAVINPGIDEFIRIDGIIGAKGTNTPNAPSIFDINALYL